MKKLLSIIMLIYMGCALTNAQPPIIIPPSGGGADATKIGTNEIRAIDINVAPTGTVFIGAAGAGNDLELGANDKIIANPGGNIEFIASTGDIFLQAGAAFTITNGANGVRIGGFIYPDVTVDGYGSSNQVLAVDGIGNIIITDPVGDNLGNHTATQDVDMATFNIINLATPSNNTDAATKAYVDAVAATPPTNTAIYAINYIHDGLSTNSITPADTYVKLVGWTVGEGTGIAQTTSNMVVQTDGTYVLMQDISFSDGNSKTFETSFFTNGSEVISGEFVRMLGSGGDVGSAGSHAILPLSIGDIVDVRMQCKASTGDVVIEAGQFSMQRISSVTAGTNWAQYAAAQNVDMNGSSLTNGTAVLNVEDSTVDASGFSGNLTAADDTVQEVAEALDTLAVGGGGIFESVGDVNAHAPVEGGHTVEATQDHVVIGGGTNNTINTTATYSTIGGGSGNTIQSQYGTISGGNANIIESSAERGTIAGGYDNEINTASDDCFIGGGQQHFADGNYVFIGGGLNISVSSNDGVVGGGANHVIAASSSYSAILGGYDAYIQGQYSTVGGGSGNEIDTTSNYSFIGGGQLNNVSDDYCTIAGGRSNEAGPGLYNFIGGGYQNTADGGASYAVIGGGYQNDINTSASNYNTIGGGQGNIITGSGDWSVIGGGYDNTINSGTGQSVIAGGRGNGITGQYSSLLGGYGNSTDGSYSAVLGGFSMILNSDYSVGFAGDELTWDIDFSDVFGGSNDSMSYGNEPLMGRTILQRQTSTTNATEMCTIPSTSQYFTLSEDSAYFFELKVMAVQVSTESNHAVYTAKGVIARTGGTTALTTIDAVTAEHEWNAALDCTIAADDANDRLAITVYGLAGTTVQWVAELEFIGIRDG